jgi:hypothetical protein
MFRSSLNRVLDWADRALAWEEAEFEAEDGGAGTEAGARGAVHGAPGAVAPGVAPAAVHPHRRELRWERARRPGTLPRPPAHCISPVIRRGAGERARDGSAR